jgi:hypothetical protein
MEKIIDEMKINEKGEDTEKNNMQENINEIKIMEAEKLTLIEPEKKEKKKKHVSFNITPERKEFEVTEDDEKAEVSIIFDSDKIKKIEEATQDEEKIGKFNTIMIYKIKKQK